jgi:hypothetical protein
MLKIFSAVDGEEQGRETAPHKAVAKEEAARKALQKLGVQ